MLYRSALTGSDYTLRIVKALYLVPGTYSKTTMDISVLHCSSRLNVVLHRNRVGTNSTRQGWQRWLCMSCCSSLPVTAVLLM